MTVFALIKQGGVSLYPLCVCSFLVLAVILERLWTYTRVGKMPTELFDKVRKALARNDSAEALRLLNTSPSPYAKIAKESLQSHLTDPLDTPDTLAMAIEEEIARAMQPLPVLSTIGNIAPFIGLFGTVLGIMAAFQVVASHGTDPKLTMPAISEALIATAVGLSIGICAVVANNWCHAWVDSYRLQLDHFCTRWNKQLTNFSAKSNGAVPSKTDRRLEPVA
jgi:biopolymer transport protein ExbB